MLTRGIREVPMPSVRTIVDKNGTSHRVAEFTEEHRQFLQDLRETVVQLRSNQAPLPIPTNFKVTPLAFANLLQWTRVTGADYYEVLWNTTANLTTANVQGVGDSASWVDHIGNGAITRFYWVRARKFTGSASSESVALSGTTLASGTGVTPPAPPPSGALIVIDQTTGHQVYYAPVGGRRLTTL